ncbi:MAG TPA: hypothetical protein VK522_14440 [Pseudolabrys sp.]|nr:hypothetical protein [Pseudolabrys sp.]
MPDGASQRHQLALKLAVLVLTVAAIGLPVNSLDAYALLVMAGVVIFSGAVRATSRAWLGAGAIVAITVGGQILLAPPRIDEGHNVFLPSPALEQGLPGDVYRHLKDEFDKEYPPGVRCAPGSTGCWQNGGKNQGLPDRPFAFSPDGIFQKSKMSRSVTEIDFSDPVWLRLGFINEIKYNWYTAAPDVHRADRDRRIWMGLNRWHLTMPWFEMIRLPAAMVGGKLCWRGDVLWESAAEHFALWRGDGCRDIEPADAGRRVVGVAIKPDTLAMRLTPPWPAWWLQLASQALMIVGAAGLVLTLVRFERRRLVVPCGLIVLAMIVIAVDDASFLGGVRPFDGGDDGLFYEGYGRVILEKLLAGDIFGALEGGEKVFYYGGPGLRYFRAVEHIFFGDSYLGYLTLVILLPFLVLGLFRRFLPERWALALVFLFVAIPIGELFGTTFIDYTKWAARGFADPAAYILFLGGLLPIFGTTAAGPSRNFAPAFFGALLLALAIIMKPIVLPAAGVMLAGASVATLVQRQWLRLAGLCIGFVPVLSMALHNWVYGHVFVPLSANAAHPDVLVMPPSAYAAALRELVTFDVGGGYFGRALMQIPRWLSGPAESFATVPLNAAGVVVLVYVVIWGRRFDPWLRLVGGAALIQHAVALFYVATPRYHFLTWFLTMLVAMVFLQHIGMDWFKRRYPAMSERTQSHPLSRRLASGLARLQKASS